MSKKRKVKGKEGDNSELGKIKANAIKLLQDKPEGIHISSFWNDYKHNYGALPGHQRFGLTKRSEFLDLFADRYTKVAVNYLNILYDPCRPFRDPYLA